MSTDAAPAVEDEPVADERPGDEPVATRRGRPRAALAAVAVFTVIAAFAGGYALAPHPPLPTSASAAAGFARDMQVHHAQAVELAFDVRDLTDDPEVRSLAYDIARSQEQQAGQMYGWLDAWGLPQASARPAMAWLDQPLLGGSGSGSGAGAAGHDHGRADAGTTPHTMPGYATPEEIAHLCALSGRDAECAFLRLMIAHHEGGIAMAEDALARTRQPEVVTMARSIIASQSSEVALMQQLLAARA